MVDRVELSDAQQEQLLSEIAELARRFALELGNRHDADDLAQEVVLDCLVSMREGEWVTPASLPPFVRTLVKNKAVDLIRRSKRRASRDNVFREAGEAIEPAWASPDQVLEETEYQAFHQMTVQSFSAVRRRAFTLVREQGATYRAAADWMGVSPSTVKAHVIGAEGVFAVRLAELHLDTPVHTYRRRRGAA